MREHWIPAEPDVLIVDDDPIFRTMAASCLSVSGFRTTCASDGLEAMELLDNARFHAALIDLAMPRVDGFRLIGLIRATPALSGLSILVVSSRRDVGALNEALSLGANSFETKPVDWTLLPMQVRYLLRIPDAA